MIFREQGHARLIEAMEAAASLAVGAPTLVETEMVLVGRLGAGGRAILSSFAERNRIRTIEFDDRHREVAVDASCRYGKGNHPAELNYGDCMTYATARLAGATLLFIGNDFAKTDIAAA